jgi:hypothetical protein
MVPRQYAVKEEILPWYYDKHFWVALVGTSVVLAWGLYLYLK